MYKWKDFTIKIFLKKNLLWFCRPEVKKFPALHHNIIMLLCNFYIFAENTDRHVCKTDTDLKLNNEFKMFTIHKDRVKFVYRYLAFH